MANPITCPACGHEFEPGEIIREEVEKELRSKMMEWQKKKQAELEQQFSNEKTKLLADTETSLRKSISNDYENRLRLLESNNKENEEKLRQSRQKELEFLKKEQDILNKEKELDLQLQRMMLEERSKLTDIIRKEEADRNALKDTENNLKLKELEEKLEAQKKLAEEMKRRVEQGSMQLQGEVQEQALEEMLKAAFPFDEIKEVGKGVRGADCIQTVRNQYGQECGQIIFESKRTRDFSADWIEKLRADMRSQGADVAVLVTQAFPKDMVRFGEKNGVWICSFTEVKAVVHMLRDGIIRLSTALKSQENKGDKMHMLYDYLTSSEFTEQWNAIREGFLNMKLSIQKERDAMEKLWKAREKQLEKVLINAAHIKGSVEGIAGQDSVDLNLLQEPGNNDDPDD